MISIIIPNYNGEKLLRKNLQEVYIACEYYKLKTKEEYEIIVVDDCSSDESVEFLRSQKVTVVINEKNSGFSTTVNNGVTNAKGEIVVLVNTDVSPQKDFLVELSFSFRNENVGAVGCMDKSIEKGSIILRGRGVGKWMKGFLIHSRGEVNEESTLWVSGGSSAFRKSVWKKVGGLYEIYNPFYWEDIDLSYRIAKSGYAILFNNKSVVIHEHEKGAIKTHYSSSEVRTIAYRNQFLFVWINITDMTYLFSHFFWFFYHCVNKIRDKEYEFFSGLLAAFFLIPKIIQLRFVNKKLFTKTDHEIIERFL